MDYSTEQQKQMIMYWLLHNQATVKNVVDRLAKEKAGLLKTEPKEFHEDIQKDFIKTIRLLMEEEISRQLGFSTDIIREVLETLNISEYISV